MQGLLTDIRQDAISLAAELSIAPSELLGLAREAAQDATLLDVQHLSAEGAAALLDTLRRFSLTRGMSETSSAFFEDRP